MATELFRRLAEPTASHERNERDGHQPAATRSDPLLRGTLRDVQAVRKDLFDEEALDVARALLKSNGPRRRYTPEELKEASAEVEPIRYLKVLTLLECPGAVRTVKRRRKGQAVVDTVKDETTYELPLDGYVDMSTGLGYVAEEVADLPLLEPCVDGSRVFCLQNDPRDKSGGLVPWAPDSEGRILKESSLANARYWPDVTLVTVTGVLLDR